jgi:GDPmannose 4,6-dehydratase
MARALITGAAGQDGTYLTELLLSKGYDVWGVVGPEPGEYRAWAEERGRHLHPCEADLTDAASLARVVLEAEPDEVYSLAAISSVSLSWEHPAAVADINATGVARLLEALSAHAPAARLCQASSSEIFGHPVETPQTECTPIRPATPYGSAKAYAHFLLQNVREGQSMFACNAILYNHESPRRPVSFVTRKITDGAVRVKLGLADEVRLGNLDSARDWGYAGDYVEGMWRMLQADTADDYILATGATHTVRELCDAAFSCLDLDYREYVVVDSAFVRSADVATHCGDPAKAKRILGWEPTVTFRDLVEMMVAADMERLGTGLPG